MKNTRKHYGQKTSKGKPTAVKKDHGMIAKESNAALCRKIEVLELALKRASGSIACNPPEHYIKEAKVILSPKHVVGNPSQATRR